MADLHASASKITGLADFGPDDYTDGLAVLLSSCADEAGLTPLGRKVMRSMLRGALAARLFSEAGWQAHPEYAETAEPLDLGRLPEPDEIADAVVFLASEMARAITGQCLDVNCGEYHH